MRTWGTSVKVAAAATGGLMIALSLPATAGAAPGNACETRNNNIYAKLLGCVTLEGVQEHLAAFQQIADANDDQYFPDSRAAGTEGYQASVDYVAGLLEDAGYQVSLDPVDFTFIPSTLTQLTPTPARHPMNIAVGSGLGAVTGRVIGVDLKLAEADRAGSTSGCEATDYTGLDFSGPNDIALVQRGGCAFLVKAQIAEQQDAEAVVIMNQGDTVGAGDRFGPVNPTLAPYQATGPVVGTSFEAGVSLAQTGSTARVEVQAPETRTDVNVIAELPGKNLANVVMAGAHLDSVAAGPGINDNGSGSAALLETALMMANSKPENTLRFAWWAAEEEGLLGSTSYVEKLVETNAETGELDRIALYMNYDMVGSSNGFLGVYDADESTFEAPVVVPNGSTAIEDVYESFYTSIGEPYDDTEFSGRSDYQAFIENNIPSGGLFTGAEERKTAEQQRIWGGTTGAQFDPCYHAACDVLTNIDAEFLAVNSDLIAYAMLHFAYSTESVNGVPGKKVPSGGTPPAPAGPEGTFPGSDGGLDHGLEGSVG
jgi:Peptidase family M28/PA domain